MSALKQHTDWKVHVIVSNMGQVSDEYDTYVTCWEFDEYIESLRGKCSFEFSTEPNKDYDCVLTINL